MAITNRQVSLTMIKKDRKKGISNQEGRRVFCLFVAFFCSLSWVSFVFAQSQDNKKIEIYSGGEKFSSVDQYKKHQTARESKNISQDSTGTSQVNSKNIEEVLRDLIKSLFAAPLAGLNDGDLKKKLTDSISTLAPAGQAGNESDNKSAKPKSIEIPPSNSQ